MKMNKTHHKEALRAMAGLKDNTFDIVLTSPPFKDKEVPEDYYTWLDKFISECRRVSQIAIIFNSSTRLVDICKRYGPDRVLIWYKAGTRMSYKYEPIFIFSKNHNVKSARPTDEVNVWSDCIPVPPVLNGEQYKNPEKLYTQILKYFPWARNVLDPCMGWGTTAKSAKHQGLDFMGFEIDKERIKATNRRLQQEILVKA
jgi:DNA modification methylase